MRTAFFVAAAAFLAACSKGGDDKVLASVGKAEVTKAEFERKLNDVATEYQTYLMTPDGRRQFFNILLREKLMLAAAQDSSVVRSTEFKEEMTRFEAEQRDRLREYREYLLAKLWLDALRKDGTIAATDAEVDDYYDKHPKEVTLRHILVSSPDEAKSVKNQLKNGANFKALAKTKSVDPETASEGGAVPPFIYGELLPELGDVAFQMKIGAVEGPVRSQFGYHIVKKESEKTLSKSQSLERIRRLLEKQKLDKYLGRFGRAIR